ncbi:hypothetical protein FACS1894104_4250 [Actinomycetota bacterium]|nr:hypothetical protein FACS1894104_4250 [Actinomycetota bacterium]
MSFSVSNTAPGVASGQSTQSGTAAPASYNNGVAAVPYSVNLATANWFSDADTADTSGMSYSVVSENATGVVSIVGSTLTFTPTVADAGLSRTIVIKANDGTADSTGNVTITVAVAKAVPGVVLVAPAVTFGQSLVMTATVAYSGGAVPTGTVSFYDGASELAGSVVLTNGVAEFSTSALLGGSHNLEARYNGDAVYKGYADDNTIKGNVTATVNLAGRSITMYNPGNKTYGDAAFTLSLSDLGAGSGEVTYSVPLNNGVLTTAGSTATIVGAGTVTITATEASDGNYAAVSDSVSITVAQKELTVAVVVANKPYDGTVTATFSSASPPSLVGLVASVVGSVGLTNGIPVFANVGSADATNNGIAINFTSAFSISGTRSAHYRLTQPTGITANITIGFVPVNGTHYSSTPLHGVTGDVKWTNGIFVLTPLTDYQISTASAYPGDFDGTQNLSSAADETTGGQRTFYIRNTATGEISRLGTETYKIDTAAPTATVNYKDKGFTAFLNKITNGLFFEATVKVEILGADTGSSAGANSGVAKVEHFTTTTGFADAAAAETFGLAISGWVSGTSFDITPAEKGKLHVFARVTDYAGNFAIYYDGLLVYENSIQSGITGSYTKTTMTDVTVDANLKGNSVASIVNATDSNKALSIVEFTSSETGGTGGLGSITIRGNYLDTLDANITYSFIVTYNPMHADARLAELGSDVPLTTTFTIRVYKQTQFTTLLAAGVNSPYTYGDASVNIGATGGNGTGALSFEIVESSVTGVASLSGATATAATLNFLKPGTFKIKVTKAGDGNYEPVTATTGVVEVLYATPQVTLGAGGSGIYGGDVNLTASVIKVGIGAVPTGSVGFYVDGVHVKTATLDAAGQATYSAPLLGAGVHNFEVRYLGNAYYKAYGVAAGATADPSVRGTTSFTIGKAGQTIVLVNPGNKTWGDADFGLSLSTLGAGSGPVTYSASPTGILAITGSSAQIVGVGSVTITATKAADNDHNGATDSVTITVGKATIPALWSANAVGSGITYGKTLVNSTLSGWTVNGVGTHSGDVLSGTVTWNAPLTLPDVSAIAGVPAAYAVTFTPTGTDALHYFALQGMANVTVDKATPVLKTPLSGTPFRLKDKLADSVITGGTTSFGYGTQNLDVPGTWDWDNPGHDGTFYVYTGTYTEPASFTPTDTARFYSITAPIDVVVFSPKTVVITPPAVSNLIYGDKISNSGILAVGSLVHAVGDTPPEAVIPGTWTWSNPDDRATAVGLDAYTAELTFTPDWLQDDPAHPVPNGGYLPTTVDVQITVGPAEPDLTMVSPGDVVYGKTLDHADLSIYTVEGVFGETITGKLEWKYPDIVPSDVIGEVGIYTAVAIFTPLDSFAPLYVVKEFDIDVLVVADTEALDDLSEDIVTPLIPALHDEDYPELAIDELADALDNANTVRSTVGVTQAAVNEAYAELFAVYEAMEHDHPVLEHSANFLPMTDTSDGFYVRIKGYFGSVLPVLGVTLDDVELVHTPTAETGVHDLSKGGVHVGTLSEGSARVTFTPEFLATLENGVYTIKVNFDDGFRTGEGITTLEIRRPIVDDGSGFPGTGDDMTLWLLMILLVTAGMTVLTWRPPRLQG